MAETTTAQALPDLEPLARELYEASRKRVSGRPPWERLNQNCAYDMGMQSTAFRLAAEQRTREAAAKPLDLSTAVEG
jgi:hypothetical protein